MGILILGAVCTAGEGFLIYFLVQLIRDARRESKRLRAGTKENSGAPQFARFEIAPPAAKAIWRDGNWVRVNSGREASEPERENYWKVARRA